MREKLEAVHFALHCRGQVEQITARSPVVLGHWWWDLASAHWFDNAPRDDVRLIAVQASWSTWP